MLLELRDVSFAYPGGLRVLHDVSFGLGPGERVALLGANGAGKSTLLLHTNGLLLPTGGSVHVDGTVLAEETLRAARARVGLVFQSADDQLFLPTVLEDVAFAPLNAGQERGAAEALARATLADLGIETHADRAAHHLSGGERRLAALATVLVSRPPLLVLDEPTGDLDARGRSRVVSLLRRRGEAILLATHDLHVAAALCPRCLVLDAGRLVYDGDSSTLLADASLLEELALTCPL